MLKKQKFNIKILNGKKETNLPQTSRSLNANRVKSRKIPENLLNTGEMVFNTTNGLL